MKHGGGLEVLRAHVLYAVFRFAGAVPEALVFGSTGERRMGVSGLPFRMYKHFCKANKYSDCHCKVCLI